MGISQIRSLPPYKQKQHRTNHTMQQLVQGGSPPYTKKMPVELFLFWVESDW